METAEPVTVRCSALVVRGHSILLCHRQATDVWVLPGGSPRRSEGAAECAQREVQEETGLVVTSHRVAFVLDATSPKGEEHLFEIIFRATEDDLSASPRGGLELQLDPSFVGFDALVDLTLLPPIGAHLRHFAQGSSDDVGTAAYLGNVWRPIPGPSPHAGRS